MTLLITLLRRPSARARPRRGGTSVARRDPGMDPGPDPGRSSALSTDSCASRTTISNLYLILLSDFQVFAKTIELKQLFACLPTLINKLTST